MIRPHRRYRALDKDLGRLSMAETARFHLSRPVLRLGAGILVGVALILLALGLTGRQPGLVVMGAGLLVGGWLGLSIGANDVANVLGPAVGAGAVALGPGLALVALAEVAGAVMAGRAVADRLALGIVDQTLLAAGSAPVMMLAALIAAAGWITLATGAGLPVSTSHSIVGAIAGAGLAAGGAQAVSWPALAVMALAWVVTPLLAAALAGALLALLRVKVLEARDRVAAVRRWLPPLIGATIGLFVAFVATRLPGLPAGPAPVLLPGAAAGLATALMMRRRLDRLRAGAADATPGLKRLLGQPLLLAAVMMAFAHGAGDAGNVAGPLMVILAPGVPGGAPVPLLPLALGGVAIALGAAVFGRRLIVLVGTGITRLNPARALCITLSTAAIILVAAVLGLPVSSTHVAVGGVFGVGFAREALERRSGASPVSLPAAERRRRHLIRRSHVVTITAAWIVTVPATALLGALCCRAMLRLTGI